MLSPPCWSGVGSSWVGVFVNHPVLNVLGSGLNENEDNVFPAQSDVRGDGCVPDACTLICLHV